MSPFSTYRLRTRLVLTALMAAAPSAAALWYTGTTDRSDARAQTIQDYRQIARTAAAQEANALADVRRLLLTLAQFPALKARSPAGCEELLATILRGHTDYSSLAVVEADGSTFCGKAHDGTPIAARPWFQRAVRMRTTAVGDDQFGAATGLPEVVVTHPLLAPSGELMRIVAAAVSIGRWNAIVAGLRLPRTATLTLFDRNRTILAGSRDAQQSVGAHMPPTVPAADARDVDETTGADGVRRLLVTERVAADFDTGLSVSMSSEYGAAFGPADRLFYRQLELFGLVSLATFGALLAGGKLFVLRPARTLEGVANRLAVGDLTARADLAGGVPGMDDLGDAVDEMATALEARQRERDLAEKAVRSANERTQLALQASRAGIWDMDLTTGILRFSESLEALHGMPAGTFGGTLDALLALIEPEDRPGVRAEFARSTRERTDANVLYRTRWPDGSVHWLAGMGRTFYDDAGAPLRAAGVNFDVTERRALEEQYRQAQKMDAVGHLAGGIAHDFNNLLTGILGYCELLSDTSLNVEQRADLSELQKGGEAAARLTRQLLAFSRKQIVELHVWNLHEVLDALQDMIRRLISEDIALVFKVAPDVGMLKIDRGQIEQVIVNLVVNARDAMPTGGTLTIEADHADLETAEASALGMPAGSYVRLAIGDTGHGMTPEVMSHVFEPFFTTKAFGRGTGLGLATVYGVVKQNSGYVTVSSEPGRGATFTVYVPRACAAEAPAESPASEPTTTSGTETVVIIDDDASVAAVAWRVLQGAGYRALVANDQIEAFKLCLEQRTDLLLTDVVMPIETGSALGVRVGAIHTRLKILYMSGYTDDVIARHGVLDPGTSFLHKPFSPGALLHKVRQVLDS